MAETRPVVGGDENVWGTKLNLALDEHSVSIQDTAALAATAQVTALQALNLANELAAQPDSVTDHSQLTGLAGDDHTIYHTDARGDARYYLRTQVDSLIATRAPLADTRFTDQRVPTDLSVTNAKVAADAAISADKLADGSTNKVMTAAERTKLTGVASGATANATNAELRDRTTHTGVQAISTVTGLQTALDGKSAVGHGHAQADITGLVAALAALVSQTWGVRPVIYANSSSAFPGRAAWIAANAPGYTGPVDWNSEAYAGHGDPLDAVEGDAHIKRPVTG